MAKWDRLTMWLESRSPERIELSYDQLEKILGTPLPASARQYPWTFWSNGAADRAHRWLSAGYRTQVTDTREERVRFIRATEELHEAADREQRRGATGGADLVLVGADEPLRDDIETSMPLLELRHRYVQERASRWLILSRAYGVLSPDLDAYLRRTWRSDSALDDRSWGRQVVEALERHHGPVAGLQIELHAPTMAPIRLRLERLGADVRTPTAAVTDGRLLAWYSERFYTGRPDGARQSAQPAPIASDHGDEMYEAVGAAAMPTDRDQEAERPTASTRPPVSRRLPALHSAVDLSSPVWTRVGGGVTTAPPPQMATPPSPEPAEDVLTKSTTEATRERAGSRVSDSGPSAASTDLSDRTDGPSEGLAPYLAWDSLDRTLLPLTSPAGRRDLMVRIVQTEGPVTGDRLYRVAAEAVRAERLTMELVRLFNQATYACERSGSLLVDDPLRRGGQRGKTFRAPGQALVVPRTIGPRRVTEIPPRELAARLESLGHVRDRERAWFRAVLESYGVRHTSRDVAGWLRRCAELIGSSEGQRVEEKPRSQSSDNSSPVSPTAPTATRVSPSAARRRREQRLASLRGPRPDERALDAHHDAPADAGPQPVAPYPEGFRAARRLELQESKERMADLIQELSGRPLPWVDRNRLHNAERQLHEIDEALQRLDTADYGRCVSCGNWIAAERLETVPVVALCVGCAVNS